MECFCPRLEKSMILLPHDLHSIPFDVLIFLYMFLRNYVNIYPGWIYKEELGENAVQTQQGLIQRSSEGCYHWPRLLKSLQHFFS